MTSLSDTCAVVTIKTIEPIIAVATTDAFIAKKTTSVVVAFVAGQRIDSSCAVLRGCGLRS